MIKEALPDGDRVIKDLRQDYAAKVYFPLNKDQLDLFAQSFLDFLGLPPAFKNNEDLHFLLNDRPSADVGYLNRIKGEVGARDNKQYFHFHPEAEIKFQHLLGKEKAFDNFMEQSRIVYDYCSATAAVELSRLDSRIGGVYEQFFDAHENRRPNFFLRTLAYYPTGDGDFLAEDHNDLAAFTFAFYQSHQGIQVDSPKGMKPIEIGQNEALFFKGLQPVIGLPADLNIAEYHGVVQKPAALINPAVARVSSVFFMDVLDPITIDKSLVTTRMPH